MGKDEILAEIAYCVFLIAATGIFIYFYLSIIFTL